MQVFFLSIKIETNRGDMGKGEVDRLDQLEALNNPLEILFLNGK